MRALVIEDDSTAAAGIGMMLKGDGFVCDTVDLGKNGLRLAKQDTYDIIILDLMLPDIDGYEVLQQLRTAGVPTPVLILSGLNRLHDRTKGLGLGADDFLGKPFDRRELIARVRAIVRRAQGHSQSIVRTGRLSVNLDQQTVDVDNKPVYVTRKEYGILELLSRRKGTTLSKQAFLEHLYGGMDEPDIKIIDVFVCKLRGKLNTATGGENYIETDWSHGYVLREPLSEIRPPSHPVSR
jgi:two-component system, cell cycle response regulator CtrA